MIDPTPDDIGRKVIYTPAGDYPGKRSEEGVISSLNEKYVFVRFGSNVAGIACNRNNLTWP
jgi:hypothetical protein